MFKKIGIIKLIAKKKKLVLKISGMTPAKVDTQ